jgi:hypothetical protein
VVIIARSVVSIGRFGSDRKLATPVQDRADEQRMAGLFPMVPLLQGTFGIDQHVGDILDVAHLPLAAAHLQQRVVGGALRIGRIEDQHAAESRPPAGRQRPVLALDVMHDGRARPGQQRRDDKPDALAAAGRRKAQHMFRPIMAEIVVPPAAEQYAVMPEQPSFSHLARFGPASGAIGRDTLRLARTPHRNGDGDHDGRNAPGSGDVGALDKDVPRISVVSKPPPEKGRRMVNRQAENFEPWMAKPRLKAKPPRGPLRRRPDEGEDGGADEEHLAPEDFGRVHGDEGSG